MLDSWERAWISYALAQCLFSISFLPLLESTYVELERKDENWVGETADSDLAVFELFAFYVTFWFLEGVVASARSCLAKSFLELDLALSSRVLF